MLIVIGIVVIVVLAGLALFATAARQRATTGTLSRETVSRDHSANEPDSGDVEEAGDELARARAGEARAALATASGVPATKTPGTLAARQPIDEDELGFTRRQFFNRSILLSSALGLGSFGVAALAFLWPSASTGFGGKITVGSEADAEASFAKKEPFYNAAAKTYIVQYPKEDLAKAQKISAYTGPVIAGMEEGYVALYQRCVHLGCRVPWCQSSQWFECPCHGSKYNRVGEKQGGPAPRGLDRFALAISGGSIVVDTGVLVLGPPIGTNTTGQSPEGAPCV